MYYHFILLTRERTNQLMKIDFSKNRKFDEAVQDVVQNHARKRILHGFIELWEID
jgi:hypothetical protein